MVQPANEVQFPVPDIKIRSYFLMPGRQLADVRRLVERLRRMDVEVYRVTKAAHGAARAASSAAVPAPTSPCRRAPYWIPMDQPQKHWIQATLGEDPYVPFPYFYDVSSWSNPLLMGIDTIYTGDARAARGPSGSQRTEGGRTGAAPSNGSYTYRQDSAAAAQLTFQLLGRGVRAVRDDTLVRRAGGRVSPRPPTGSPGRSASP